MVGVSVGDSEYMLTFNNKILCSTAVGALWIDKHSNIDITCTASQRLKQAHGLDQGPALVIRSIRHPVTVIVENCHYSYMIISLHMSHS